MPFELKTKDEAYADKICLSLFFTRVCIFLRFSLPIGILISLVARELKSVFCAYYGGAYIRWTQFN